jgi:uncharacterized protein (UPF0548 family)
MFSLRKPTQSLLQERLQTARTLPLNYAVSFETQDGMAAVHVPRGYALDHTRSEIGHGRKSFETACQALQRWKHFDLGWVRVANAEVPIRTGELVAVEAHSLCLWSINISRILYVINEPNRFGFGYGTTPLHVERGEERFLLEFDPASGIVFYDLLAVSQPAHWMAKLGYPYTRSRQRKFAYDSHRRMRERIASADS